MKERQMKTRILISVIAALLLAVSWTGAEEIAGLPLHTEQLGDGAIRVWLGDHTSTTTIVAFATEKGIVVVDTFGVPEVDVKVRTVIAQEFGRDDFAYLINTHEHADHTGGNSAYSDCTIVGHELIAAGMARAAGRRAFRLEWYPQHLASLEEQLTGLESDDPGAARLKEDIIYNRLLYEANKTPRELVPPTLTFTDRLTLDLGDTTFELSYIGGMHTASDAAIFVPEYELLLTGDLMADVWLTDAPGCLGNFLVRDRMPHDFPRFLANWDRLLAKKNNITTYMPGHWNGELSYEGARVRVEYVRTLWNGVREASEEGKTVDDVLTGYTLAARFPDLAESPGFSEYGNFSSISELWREVTDQVSAARTLWTMLENGADEAALEEILAERNAESPGYFFIEAEFNAYGYSFLQQEQNDKAIRMFRINVELYPGSWNAYDSLGEALLQTGDTEKAALMYEKSLTLNPDSSSGKEALARIQSAEST